MKYKDVCRQLKKFSWMLSFLWMTSGQAVYAQESETADSTGSDQVQENTAEAQTPPPSDANAQGNEEKLAAKPIGQESNSVSPSRPGEKTAQNAADTQNSAPSVSPKCVEADLTNHTQNAEWMTLLGLAPTEEEDAFVSTDSTHKAIRALSNDPKLDQLLTLFEQYLAHSVVAEPSIMDDAVDALFSHPDLNQKEKIAVFLTISPYLIEHARSSGDLVTCRKLQQTAQSMQRLWPKQLNIVCSDDSREYRFSLSHLVRGHISQTNMLKAKPCRQNQSPTPLNCQSYAADLSDWGASLDHLLEDALWALNQKDNEFTIQAMANLGRELKRLNASYGGLPQNGDSTDDENIQKTLCQSQVIEILALEQTRFAELAAFEADLQKTTGTTFYDRLKNLKSCQLSENFASTLARLRTDHASTIKWLSDNFDPKKRKKLDKALTAWTKKGTPYVRLQRRLWASWTAWSLGEYTLAAKAAGDVMDGKSKLVHPQLYSYDLILKAIKREFPALENLQTYTRLMNLKSPALVYQTLTQCARWLSTSEKKDVVEAVRPYSPSQASYEAAEFFMAYSDELRTNMNAAHRAAVDSWLETEIALTESPEAKQQRRLTWLKDAVEAQTWDNALQVSETAIASAPTKKDEVFWCLSANHALQALGRDTAYNCEPCPDLTACATESGKFWFKDAVKCYAKIECQ
ncbi:MAG: hypothetical protein J6A01_03310 [Proteobacteria bacterium]|nr:hypothetical protein [Pseudomonadota bacterium]